jgi:hypothetical protein
MANVAVYAGLVYCLAVKWKQVWNVEGLLGRKRTL